MRVSSDQPPSIIAIDGPAASGKSTLGKRLADLLGGYLYFDTGVMYRAVTWLALNNRADINDEVEITRLAEESQIDVRPPSRPDGRDYDVWVGEQDVTWEIRRPEVEANVSAVSAYPGVRKALSFQQRRIGLRGRVVMVGRDIGTVVLPEAGLKIYLDASVEKRAKRRYLEVTARGEILSYDDILGAMRMRDQIDSTREVSPLRPAEDAVTLNSDQLSIEQVIDQVNELIAARSTSSYQARPA
jgi:cytidylate kinase